MSFIDAHDFPAGLVLRVLGVAESTYYDWRARQVIAEPPRARRRRAAGADPQDPRRARVRRHLRLPAGVAGAAPPRRAGRAQARGAAHARPRPQGAHLRRGWKGGSTRQNPHHTAAPDLVERDFPATAPNRLWVADLTRILTGEGVLWLASVRDAFANRIVGWATDPRATTTLVLTALNHALRSRDIRAGQLIFHSDKGASTRRCGSPNASSTPGSLPRPAVPGTASTTRWPRTCGPRSRSS